MSTKNRIDPAVSATITRTLHNVLANGPGFLNCPLWSCHEQKRASPFPSGWAEYPKDKVERLLLELARCHLLSGSQRHNVHGVRFNWAENLSL